MCVCMHLRNKVRMCVLPRSKTNKFFSNPWYR